MLKTSSEEIRKGFGNRNHHLHRIMSGLLVQIFWTRRRASENLCSGLWSHKAKLVFAACCLVRIIAFSRCWLTSQRIVLSGFVGPAEFCWLVPQLGQRASLSLEDMTQSYQCGHVWWWI